MADWGEGWTTRGDEGFEGSSGWWGLLMGSDFPSLSEFISKYKQTKSNNKYFQFSLLNRETITPPKYIIIQTNILNVFPVPTTQQEPTAANTATDRSPAYPVVQSDTPKTTQKQKKPKAQSSLPSSSPWCILRCSWRCKGTQRRWGDTSSWCMMSKAGRRLGWTGWGRNWRFRWRRSSRRRRGRGGGRLGGRFGLRSWLGDGSRF